MTSMNKTIKMALAVTVLTFVAVGCGSDSDSKKGSGEVTTEAPSEATNAPAAAQTISVGAKEFAFDPSAIEATADSEFTVELTNTGVIEHDFTITGQESAKIVAAGGATASGSFTLSAGTYEYFCSVVGHKESGMIGTLTVT